MKRFRLVALLALLGVGIGTFFMIQFYRVFLWDNTAFESPEHIVFIDRDDTIDSLLLQLRPYLKSTQNFRLAAQKKGYTSNLKSGKYRLIQGMGNNQIINTLRSDAQVVQVTFNNQERVENLAGRVATQLEADSLELLNAFCDSTFLIQKGFSKESAISYFLPNTYDFYWNVTPITFRNKMWQYYQSFWNETRQKQAQNIGLSPQEVSVLASIVQKETNQKEEYARVAGVYLNRLKRKMKLQADPTVIYALKKKRQDFELVIKRVLLKDLKVDSPYNTYKYYGLPPGPITMPDIRVIDAVLNAEQHKYLYFVVNPSKPGFHLFASTLREHNRNRFKYTQWLNRRKVFR